MILLIASAAFDGTTLRLGNQYTVLATVSIEKRSMHHRMKRPLSHYETR
ncbi:hypothetical protein O9993_16625 [Vibrio lentus]|nr:hypothetical protein [Vibrio lentus]